MGNTVPLKTTNVAPLSKVSTPAFPIATERGLQLRPGKSIGAKLPPLHVVKDCAVQTDTSDYNIVKSRFFSLAGLFVLASISYFGLCYLIICSNYIQALVVYSHYVKEDLPLRELEKMGLPEAKNIEIITEDGVLLRGWHLMNPSSNIIHANMLQPHERDIYFDQTLAHTERVVIYFHGNSHTRGQGFRLRKIKQMATYLNAHVIAFDYRGFGDSEGFPSEEGTHLDARAVVHHVDNVVRRYNLHATGYLSSSSSFSSSGGLAEDTRMTRVSGDKHTDNGQREPSHDSLSDGVFGQIMGLLDSHKELFSEAAAKILPASGYDLLNTTILPDIFPASAGGGGEGVATMGNDVKNKNKQPNLFIYGHSLGAAISTAIAVEVSNGRPGALTGLILDCPFTVLPEAIKNHPLTNPFRTFPWIFDIM